MIREDLTGREYGRWTVIKRDDIRKTPCWICQCSCDDKTIKSVYAGDLKAGKSKSCHCIRAEMVAQRNKDNSTHGMFGTPEYSAWSAMIQRCYNENCNSYYRYGGRGIKVCDKWRNCFEEFFKDMGLKPKGKSISIGRINNDGNYTPQNCQWETSIQQANNRSNNTLITYNNETLTLQEWSDKIGIPPDTLSRRIKRLKWDLFRALTTSVDDYKIRGNK